MIDGFQSVQAVKRSGKGSAPRTRQSSTRLPNAEKIKEQQRQKPSALSSPASRIGRTVMPEKHELVCYECDYAFSLTGRLDKTFCPKCRKQLDTKNYVVEGTWKLSVKTMGTITVNADASAAAVSMVCQNIVIAGDVRNANVHACRRVELKAGASFDFATITCKDLLVHDGANVSVRRKASFRSVEIRGYFSGNLSVTDEIVIKPGGCFKGTLHAPRLTIEDGGGLSAKLYLGPDEGISHKAEAA